MPEIMDSTLLARYLAGEASADERARVEAWIAADPAHGAEVERLRGVWGARRRGEWDLDRAWARVSTRLDRETGAQVADLPSSHRALLRRWAALAASLVLVTGAFWLWRALSPEPGGFPAVVLTAAGERRALNLPDGSRITLAPRSELRVARPYGDGERRVDLSGEAWFEVRHDESRPFRVHAAKAIVEDLGTEFAVRAETGSSPVRVVVVSGSASLRREGDPAEAGVVLNARDVGVLAADGSAPTVERHAAVEPLVAWQRGELIFEDSQLDSVAAELARWYGVVVRFGDSALAVRRLTATLHLDDLDEALQILRGSLGVQVQRLGDTVVVR
jgi:transmembrane sensor